MKVDRGTAVAALLGGSLAAAVSLGVTHEGMLQDTFKSAIVAIGVLVAALVFAWPRSDDGFAIRWHPVLLLPLLLCTYALAGMAWAQPWQAGVEAVRWLLIAAVAALATQVFDDPRRCLMLAWAVSIGAMVASAWVVPQFLFAFDLFPQGARPAATFVNRNFFAEFAVCALPFIAFLVTQEGKLVRAVSMAVAAGVVITAICMTGARAALVALMVLVAIVVLLVVGGVRKAPGSGVRNSILAACTLATAIAAGTIHTGDPQIAAEGRGVTALSRAFVRASSIPSGDDAMTMRIQLWSATGKMIDAHPLAGIGAGAWESDADYYAHNDWLQLIAEYGLVGWHFLAALAVWLVRVARNVDRDADAWRWALLGSLLALFIVGNAGYPMHLAATGTLFALCMGSLAATRARPVRISRSATTAMAAACAAGLALAAYATWTASLAESRLARAAHIALDIGGTSNPNDPRWSPARSEMLRLVDEGMRLHPNERQLTPLVADELGRWGDWPNAIRIWEHVLRAHPDKVVILTNVARGYIAIGRPEIARAYLDKARRIAPDAPSVRAVETLMRQMSSSKG